MRLVRAAGIRLSRFVSWALRQALKVIPATVQSRHLALVRYAERFQLTAGVMAFVRDHLPVDDGTLLVFGVGRDSTTWAMLNRHGRTAFIEDNPHWVARTRRRAPELEIHVVKYETTVADSVGYTSSTEIPKPALPPGVENVAWDLVVVDAPNGASPDAPGRASSIAFAARLVRPGGWVVVDDHIRDLERHMTSLVFPGIPPLVIDPSRAVTVAFHC